MPVRWPRSGPARVTSVPQAVVVTGASSGIGRATAVAYAACGADVTLVARSRGLLDDAAEHCRRVGASSTTVAVANVLDAEAMDRVMADARDRAGHLDVVVHAAMVMAYGRIEDLPLEVLDRVMKTATHGTSRVARSALAVFRQQDRGSLVIVTSLLGSVAVPGIGAYVTGKWAQLGLARTLQLETRDAPDIVISTVSPGGVDTPIYWRAANVEGPVGAPPPPAYAPERVARAILRAADHRRKRMSVGVLNQLVVAGFRFVTPLYDVLVGPLYERLAHGDDLVAPTNGNVFVPSGSVELDASATADHQRAGGSMAVASDACS